MAELDPGAHASAACGVGLGRLEPSADDNDGIDKADGWGDFLTQISAESLASASTGVTSRQCTAEADVLAQQVLEEEALREAVSAACVECSFCVTVADPRLPDFPLIAVSRGFEAMTGFRSEEILGVNCRFLSCDCGLDLATVAGLRRACSTGQPFTGVITNRKKSGELFLNLLDLRGLTVGRTHTGEDLWYLVGIQADVSHLPEAEQPPARAGALALLLAALAAAALPAEAPAAARRGGGLSSASITL
ncbi:unnamed protein product [Prorocentrum cordatum]|uniref:PAS domain-containing protein n=1 Tax=Prorocentrum cordatum TaxID=2364126 RepID=A0ABN9T4K3_9DINO|nr:unnamed protein product [Polarella glacialis]